MERLHSKRIAYGNNSGLPSSIGTRRKRKAALTIVSIICISTIFYGCKKCGSRELASVPVKTIDRITTNDGQIQNYLIFRYNPNRQVSYVGLVDFTNGYTYTYQGTQISKIEHKTNGFTYEIQLTYSGNRTLANADFIVKKAGVVSASIPLTCTTTEDLTVLSTNSNELAYLELRLKDGNLVKALTNAFYLKTSINFAYNEAKGRVYGNSIPLTQLKNPIYPTAEIRVNELISLALQAFSSKQLHSFQSQYSSAILSYIQNSGEVSLINCRVQEQDPDGTLKRSTETAITYTYSN